MSGIQVEHKQRFGPQDLTPGTAFPGFGTSHSTAAYGDDSRFSDARTPTAHAASHNAGGGDALAADAAAGTASLRTLGTGAQQAAAGNDGRLTDTRTPTASSVNSTHEANAVEMLASPVVQHGVGMVVLPFTTPATTGSVGFVADRKYEVISAAVHKIGTTGGAADTLDLQVGGASILTGAASLNAKAAGAFVAMPLDATKQIIAAGATVTLLGTAGTTDCACRGYLQLMPVS